MKRKTSKPFSWWAVGSGNRRRPVSRTAPGFSLIEIMVVVSLMTVIILGLVTMFGQTQKAFRGSMTQVDVMASGRATMDLLTRELEQITPSYQTNVDNFYVTRRPANPLIQPLPGTTEQRTNVLEEFYFLARENQQWSGIGYLVSTPYNGVGSLYRFQIPPPPTNNVAVFSSVFQQVASLAFTNNISTNLNRMADGVVHLRVQAYDTNGYLIVRSPNLNLMTVQTNDVPTAIHYFFRSNALPAYLDVELGILEQRTLERVRSIPDATAQRVFLENHAGQVHVFRQRIPVRNVDPAAYQ